MWEHYWVVEDSPRRQTPRRLLQATSKEAVRMGRPTTPVRAALNKEHRMREINHPQQAQRPPLPRLHRQKQHRRRLPLPTTMAVAWLSQPHYQAWGNFSEAPLPHPRHRPLQQAQRQQWLPQVRLPPRPPHPPAHRLRPPSRPPQRFPPRPHCSSPFLPSSRQPGQQTSHQPRRTTPLRRLRRHHPPPAHRHPLRTRPRPMRLPRPSCRVPRPPMAYRNQTASPTSRPPSLPLPPLSEALPSCWSLASFCTGRRGGASAEGQGKGHSSTIPRSMAGSQRSNFTMRTSLTRREITRMGRGC